MSLHLARSKTRQLQKLVDQLQLSQYKCSRDKDWNLIVTFQDSKQIKLPVFALRPYQIDVQANLFSKKKKRFFLVRPRRSGKEVESWTMLYEAAIETPGIYMMIYPTNVRARKILWDGAITMKDGSSKKFLDMIPPQFLRKDPDNTRMQIDLINGSVIHVLGSNDANSLRGPNPRGVVMSEYAWCDPEARRVLMPILKENGGWLILQTTWFGRNHAYKLMELVAANERWYCRVDSVETLLDENGQRYITDEMIQEDRDDGMSEPMIQQEYYSSVQLDESLIYFAVEMTAIRTQKRIAKNLLMPGKAAYLAMDIGMSDDCANCIVQLDENNWPVVVHYFWGNNKKYDHYFRIWEKWCIQHGIVPRKIFAPHDGAQRDKGTEKDITDYAEEAGYECEIVQRPKSHVNAIQLIRKWLNKTRFSDEDTARLIECLENYSKQYDEENDVYLDSPEHNWSSHGVKSLQTMFIALENDQVIEARPPIVYYNE